LPSSSALARSRKPRLRQELLAERVYRPLAHLVVVALLPLRVPPPAVVLASLATGVTAAVELAHGRLIVAALLLQLKTVLDNADGQLARLSGRVTLFGRYLDSECDLLVNVALFAALGLSTDAPVAAALGFAALTAVLSVNFNLERLARGPRPGAAESVPTGATAVLARMYALAYGWQDRLVERLVERRRGAETAGATGAYHDLTAVGVLANLGLSTQLGAFGLCIALGHPLAYVCLLLGEVALVAVLLARRGQTITAQGEVSLEHR
jgi:archaetidylinositol phosphate synthase